MGCSCGTACGYVPGAGEIESLTNSMVDIILTKLKLG